MDNNVESDKSGGMALVTIEEIPLKIGQMKCD